MTTNHESAKNILRQFLAERNQYPERAEAIDAKICELYLRRVAILVLDMSGFSRLTIEYGIIHYLAMIEQMYRASTPAVTTNRGVVIKQEADNLFAAFDDPTDAVEAALDIFRAFAAVNTVVPENRDLFGCVGIGFGDTLVIGEDDMFGSQMNLASKLGEDLAGPSEILLTEEAHQAIAPDRFLFVPRTYTIGELSLECYAFARRTAVTEPLVP